MQSCSNEGVQFFLKLERDCIGLLFVVGAGLYSVS